jgi:hypothetical protein
MKGVASESGRGLRGRQGGGECLVFGPPYAAMDVAPPYSPASPSCRGIPQVRGAEESRKSFGFRARFLASLRLSLRAVSGVEPALGMTSVTSISQHPARQRIEKGFEGGIRWETDKDTKIEGTNSRICCKQRSYRFFEAKNELVFECKKRQKNSKNSAKTAKKRCSKGRAGVSGVADCWSPMAPCRALEIPYS